MAKSSSYGLGLPLMSPGEGVNGKWYSRGWFSLMIDRHGVGNVLFYHAYDSNHRLAQCTVIKWLMR